MLRKTQIRTWKRRQWELLAATVNIAAALLIALAQFLLPIPLQNGWVTASIFGLIGITWLLPARWTGWRALISLSVALGGTLYFLLA